MTVKPLFWPKDRILVIFDSRYGIRCCFWLMASTHCERTNRLLFILADSTSRSLPLSVLRLSSEPARSIADAVLIRVSSPLIIATLTHKIACDRDEWAFSYSKRSATNHSTTLRPLQPLSPKSTDSHSLDHTASQTPSNSRTASPSSPQPQSSPHYP